MFHLVQQALCTFVMCARLCSLGPSRRAGSSSISQKTHPGCVQRSMMLSSCAGFLLTSNVSREISIKPISWELVFYFISLCFACPVSSKKTFLPMGTELFIPQTSLCLLTVANTVTRSKNLGHNIKRAFFLVAVITYSSHILSLAQTFSGLFHKGIWCYLMRLPKLSKILFNTGSLQRTCG